MERVDSDRASALLRSLPSVDEVLRSDIAGKWLAHLHRERVTDLVRDAIAELRERILSGHATSGGAPIDAVRASVDGTIRSLSRHSLRPVINASGVILHTNLGRAPLSSPAIQAIIATSSTYNNLEYDIGTGGRGQRDVHCGRLLEMLLGAPAIVVNNNAAAIFLVLRELASGGEVIVSRGELVEIGDGFRIPDILAASGAILREVGATNRTRADDYRRAISPATEALLRIHPSNFRQIGFTGKPSLAQLVELARSHSIPVIEDLGSGCLVDLSREGIEDEPPVRKCLAAGADVVTFSGDKLLGGPQAGVIAGNSDLVARIRRNPLFRALRVDKLTLAALEATLRSYLSDHEDEIPALQLMRTKAERLTVRAERLATRLVRHGACSAETVVCESLLGGGSAPMQSLPSAAVAIAPCGGMTARELEVKLRSNDPPVVARIERNRLLLDLRTVFETEEEALLTAVLNAAGQGEQQERG